MVSIIIDRNKLEEDRDKIQELIMFQIKQLCKRVSPDYKFDQIRLKISAENILRDC